MGHAGGKGTSRKATARRLRRSQRRAPAAPSAPRARLAPTAGRHRPQAGVRDRWYTAAPLSVRLHRPLARRRTSTARGPVDTRARRPARRSRSTRGGRRWGSGRSAAAGPRPSRTRMQGGRGVHSGGVWWEAAAGTRNSCVPSPTDKRAAAAQTPAALPALTAGIQLSVCANPQRRALALSLLGRHAAPSPPAAGPLQGEGDELCRPFSYPRERGRDGLACQPEQAGGRRRQASRRRRRAAAAGGSHVN